MGCAVSPPSPGETGKTAKRQESGMTTPQPRLFETHLCLLDVRAFVAELLAVGADLVRHRRAIALDLNAKGGQASASSLRIEPGRRTRVQSVGLARWKKGTFTFFRRQTSPGTVSSMAGAGESSATQYCRNGAQGPGSGEAER